MEQRFISHYRVLGKLGEGGMGEVYLTEDTRLERKAALKLLPARFADDPERLARFRREAKTVASLNHPNIVTIYSVEEGDSGPFLTMELVDGLTLEEVVPSEGLPLREFFEIALPLTDALSAAHEQGVTHRDLKPGNVMVGHDRRVKILDFGLAKLLEDEHDRSDLTGGSRPDASDGRILGTLPYMAPEQVRGESVNQRSDIFSLGIVLYEMASGKRPFTGNSSAELVSAILTESPPPVTEVNANLPAPLARVIRLCLEKDPRHRFQTAADVHNMLRSLMVEFGLFPGVTSGEAIERHSGARRWRALTPSEFELEDLVRTRVGLTALLGGLLLLNWAETAAEETMLAGFDVFARLGDAVARAMNWLEAGISFEHHGATSILAVYGNSVAYFFVLPVLAVTTGLTLARRSRISPFRVFCLSIMATYLISLPFFIFFPVPERWSHHGSEAILLSDLWSSRLIEAFRPISGLDNCFPSFHVSLTVVIVLCCYLYRVRMRTAVLFLGLMVVLSTFVLGIHWLPDVAAGAATGSIGVAVARRLDRAIARRSVG